MRFGECLPNPFGGGEMTLWFHPLCAAYKRPQPILDAMAEVNPELKDREELERVGRRGLEHTRLPRIDGAERSRSGQARCRCCHELIPRDSWRIRILFFEEGRFSPGGHLHLACRKEYFETGEVLDQVLHFSPGLSEEDRADLVRSAAEA